jgi:hypothetical protein
MGRAVRVKSQLKSHKSFASAFESYCDLVDNARLFSTNSMGSTKVMLIDCAVSHPSCHGLFLSASLGDVVFVSYIHWLVVLPSFIEFLINYPFGNFP